MEDRRRGEPLYIPDVNPHLSLRRLNATGQEGYWECNGCSLRGWIEDFNLACAAPPPPPCSYCGLTPICAVDCKGILELLTSPRVHIAGAVREADGD